MSRTNIGSEYWMQVSTPLITDGTSQLSIGAGSTYPYANGYACALCGAWVNYGTWGHTCSWSIGPIAQPTPQINIYPVDNSKEILELSKKLDESQEELASIKKEIKKLRKAVDNLE